MKKITIKTDAELEIMAEAGKKLAKVKNALKEAVKVGTNAYEIEELAMSLIKKEGAEASFVKVPGYHWATCVNKNDGLVHGIPTKDVVFEKGDIISVDVGLFYKGFHSDTSFTVGLEPSAESSIFMEVGRKALNKAIKEARPGRFISDISRAIQNTVEGAGYSAVRALTGHGIGRDLHEEPGIPCFVTGKDDIKIVPGMALAIEVMYTLGSPELVMEKDGWTISTHDGKISALYEETVIVTKSGSRVVTT